MYTTSISFLIYLVDIIYPRYNSYCFIFYMVVNYCIILKQRHRYTLQAVSPKLLLRLLRGTGIDDVHNALIVGNGIQSSIKIAEVDSYSGGKIMRKVFVISKKLDTEGVALLSHTLLCNLKKAVKCSFTSCDEKIVKFADEVELSLISAPNDWSHFVIDSCLKNYFKTPKLLYKGDILEVNLKIHGRDTFYASNKITNIHDSLYFRCNKVIYHGLNINADGLFCVTDKSVLKQATNIQNFIPKMIYDLNEDFIMSPYPPSLNTYFQSMKRTIELFINGNMNFTPIFLLEGHRGSGKHLLIQSIAHYFGMHLYTIHNFEICANVYAQNETKLRNVFFCAKMAAPCILEISNFENFGKNNEGQYDERLINYFTEELTNFFRNNLFPTIIFCTSNEKNIPLELKRVFLKTFEIKSPNVEEREKALQWYLNKFNIHTGINLKNIANKTHGFLLEDLKALICYPVSDFQKQNTNCIREEHFLKAVDLMQSSYNESLGAPKVPRVQWSDIGGLAEVKEEIIKTIKLPLKYPDLLKETGLRRSGILLFGPPGTGKTLIAKAVATECGLCFLSVKGPELLNMYVGQSEQNVREVFQRGREASPCIIFFDELDSLAPNRGAAGDSGGVMDRVVSQLLAEMDGLNRAGDIFIIGATNRPDLIDPALLRPGRFDKLLYVGPCTDKESKVAVLTALTKGFKLSEKSVVDKVVNMCPENITGADFYGICSNAWLYAARKLITTIEGGSGKNADGTSLDDVVVTLDDFQSVINKIKPSIRPEDLENFQKLKSEFT